MTFYNELLEKQERYQQETPEQREAEKAWIEQQHQQIQQVRQGIEAILA
jgi:DNA-binding protein H-NS